MERSARGQCAARAGTEHMDDTSPAEYCLHGGRATVGGARDASKERTAGETHTTHIQA